MQELTERSVKQQSSSFSLLTLSLSLSAANSWVRVVARIN